MSEHRRAWLAAGIALVVTGSGLVLAFLPGGVPLGHKFALAAIGASLALSYSIVGAIVASRRPENAIGWLFLVASGLWAITVLAAGYATFAVSHGTTNSQLAIRADWLQAWLYAPALFVAILPMFLLFPDGRPLTPRWRPLVALAFVAIVTGAFLEATMPASYEANGAETAFITANPYVVSMPQWLVSALNVIAGAGLVIVLVGGLVSLGLRFRRSRGDERAQLRWLLYAFACLFTASVLLYGVSTYLFHSDPYSGPGILPIVSVVLTFGSIVFVPIAMGIAIVKYRLYDLDVVITKTVVYATLAAFITGVYVAIVVGLGHALRSEHSVVLSVAATAIVAVAFQPVRVRVQHVANRLVYGRRADPYEVMAGFAERVAGTLSVDRVLPEMAEAAALGVGAAQARIRVFLAGGDRDVVWPPGADGHVGVAETIPVAYQGTPVGEITVTKPPNDPLTPGEGGLLGDLARQAGLALHNVRLTDELALRLQELAEQSAQLQISRQRLVTARDAQRRGLERDIREGPERRLIDIGRRVRDATALVDADPGSTEALLDRLGADANTTLEGLRDLARGIFPPLLADQGIVPALEAHVRKVGANATIELDPALRDRRFDADTEACVYFCCLQAIQNVIRHAGNAACTIRLGLDDRGLVFSIRDEGPGFDADARPPGMGRQIMMDRVDALEGRLEIDAAPGKGATVTIHIPLRKAEVVL